VGIACFDMIVALWACLDMIEALWPISTQLNDARRKGRTHVTAGTSCHCRLCNVSTLIFNLSCLLFAIQFDPNIFP